jgi:hypothetical protein
MANLMVLELLTFKMAHSIMENLNLGRRKGKGCTFTPMAHFMMDSLANKNLMGTELYST